MAGRLGVVERGAARAVGPSQGGGKEGGAAGLGGERKGNRCKEGERGRSRERERNYRKEGGGCLGGWLSEEMERLRKPTVEDGEGGCSLAIGDEQGGEGSLLDFMWERGRGRRRPERDGRGKRRELLGFMWERGRGRRRRRELLEEREREWGEHRSFGGRWKGGDVGCLLGEMGRKRRWRWWLLGDEEREAVAVALGDEKREAVVVALGRVFSLGEGEGLYFQGGGEGERWWSL